MPGLRLRKITDEGGVAALWIKATAYRRSMLLRLVGMVVFTVVVLLPGITRGLQRPAVVVGSTVHPLAAWAGLRLARRYDVPFVFEIRDVWPDALVQLGKLKENSPVSRVMRALSVHLAKRAVLVISPLPRIDQYLAAHGIEPSKFRWVSNGFDGAREDPPPRLIGRDEFTFMYLGAHGNANALDGIIEAFDLLCRTYPGTKYRLRLVGDGPLKPQLKARAEQCQSAASISFEDRIPQSQVIERAREADCLIANLHDSPVYDYGISPNKLFSYLYSARPIVFGCSAPNNPVADASAGLVVPGDDRIALAEAMRRISTTDILSRSRMAMSGYDHVLEHYSHSALAGRMAAALAEANSGSVSRPATLE